MSEFYDEIVFHEPSQLMQQMLNSIQPVTSGSWVHETDCKLLSYSFLKHFLFILLKLILVEDKKIKSLEHILETRKKVKSEIAQLKQKLQQTRDKIAEYKEMAAANNPQQ